MNHTTYSLHRCLDDLGDAFLDQLSSNLDHTTLQEKRRAIELNYIPHITALIADGADVDEHDFYKEFSILRISLYEQQINDLLAQTDTPSKDAVTELGIRIGHYEILVNAVKDTGKQNYDPEKGFLCEVEHIETLRHYIEDNAFVENYSLLDTPLLIAIQMGCFDITELLITHGADVNLKQPLLWTLSNEEVSRLLIANGADVNIQNSAGDTPLYTAIKNGYFDLATYLLDQKADPNTINSATMSPLHEAAIRAPQKIVTRLIHNGAHINCVNRYDDTPLDYANEYNRHDIAQFLMEKGGIRNKTYQEEHSTVEYAGALTLPSGKIVACEPLGEIMKPFTKSITPGSYPVYIVVKHFRNGDSRVAGAYIMFSNKSISSWENALFENTIKTDHTEDESIGYPVDTATGCFMDKNASRILDEEICEDQTRLMLLYEEVINKVGHSYTYQIDDNHTIILFDSGWGDGVYASFWGYDNNGSPICLLTDFNVLELNELFPLIENQHTGKG